MSYMRRLTGKVLALWLVSSLAVALQPCCELIASSLPHERSEIAELQPPHYNHEHVTDQSSNNEAGSHTVSDNGHCDSNATGSGLYVDMQPTVTQVRYDRFDPVAIISISPDIEKFTSRVSFDLLNIVAQPPPSRQHTYLVTQRFRI